MKNPKTEKNPRGAGARARPGILVNLNTRLRLSENAAEWYEQQPNKAKALTELIEIASAIKTIE